MKFVAVIVTYHPDPKQLFKNIAAIIDDLDLLILFQNSMLDISTKERLIDTYKDKLIFHGVGKNIGIASALNHAAKWCVDNNYDFLLSLDQDSRFIGDNLPRYKQKVTSYPSITDVGVFGVNINNRGNLLYGEEIGSIEVLETITSGSIYPVNIFRDDNYFDDDLFIDAVDYEFCYRLRTQQNLKTIVFADIHLEHEVGEGLRTKWGFTTDNYSAFRTYYIIRNQLIIWRKYPELFSPSYKKTYVKGHILGRIVKILLAENKKYPKIKSIIVGFYHGLRGKKGYYNIG